jgi:hypothetical protein
LAYRSLLPWFCHLTLPAALVSYVAFRLLTEPFLFPFQQMLGTIGFAWLSAGLCPLLTRRGRELVRRNGAGALISTCLLIGLLVCGEIALRYRGNPRVKNQGIQFGHPTRGWTNRPDATWLSKSREFDQTVRTNSRGLRDVEHDLEPQPGVHRILVLGDSFMAAEEVEFEECVSGRLGARLAERGVEVINSGVRGYGTAQELLFLEEEGLAYKPDLVVVAVFLGNDLVDNLRALGENAIHGPDPFYEARPFAVIDRVTNELGWEPPDFGNADQSQERPPIERRSLLLRRIPVPRIFRSRLPETLPKIYADLNIAHGIYASAFDPDLGFSGHAANDYRDLFEEAWSVTIRLLLEMRARSEEVGAPLVVLVIPSDYAIGEREIESIKEGRLELDTSIPSRRLAAAAEEHGLRILDLTESLRAAAQQGQGPFCFPGDKHWTPEGHRFAADRLIDYTVRKGLVPAVK